MEYSYNGILFRHKKESRHNSNLKEEKQSQLFHPFIYMNSPKRPPIPPHHTPTHQLSPCCESNSVTSEILIKPQEKGHQALRLTGSTQCAPESHRRSSPASRRYRGILRNLGWTLRAIMAEQVLLQELSRKLCSSDAFLQASAFAHLRRTLPGVLVSANTPLGQTESGHTNPWEGLAAHPCGTSGRR